MKTTPDTDALLIETLEEPLDDEWLDAELSDFERELGLR